MRGLFIEELLFTALNLMFYKVLLGIDKMPKVRTALLFSVSALVFIIFQSISPESEIMKAFSNIVDMVLYLYWVSYFGLTIKDSIVLASMSSVLIKPPIILLSSLVLKITEFIFNIEIFDKMMDSNAIVLIFIAVLFIFGKFTPLSKITRFMLTQKNLIKNVIIILYFLILILVYIPVDSINLGNRSIDVVDASAFALFTIIAFSEIIILKIHSDNKRTAENLMRQQQYISDFMELSKSYRDVYLKNKDTLHAFAHDKDSKWDSNLYKPQTDVMNTLALLQNKTLAAYLYSQYLLASQGDINFTCRIDGTIDSSRFPDFQWIEIMGILLNNAMESTRQTSTPQIDIAFEEPCTIKVTNKSQPLSPQTIKNLFTKNNTTKGKNRGIGLYKLKQMVSNKGDFVVEYDAQSSDFIATITL